MLKKILKKFGYMKEATHISVVAILGNEISQLKEAVSKGEEANLMLRTEVTSLRHQEGPKPKFLVDISLGDPIPKDSESRKMYVASVASFFKDIMEPKLKYMISNTHNMSEEVTNDRDFDLILKGVTYSFREMIKWGNAMVNEQVANQTAEVSEEDMQSLKDKLKDN